MVKDLFVSACAENKIQLVRYLLGKDIEKSVSSLSHRNHFNTLRVDFLLMGNVYEKTLEKKDIFLTFLSAVGADVHWRNEVQSTVLIGILNY